VSCWWAKQLNIPFASRVQLLRSPWGIEGLRRRGLRQAQPERVQESSPARHLYLPL